MTAELQNALLIHNPKAGNGGSARRRLLDQARHIFAARGIDADLAETTGPGHATEIAARAAAENRGLVIACGGDGTLNEIVDRKSTRLNSSHGYISYAVFCLKKKKKIRRPAPVLSHPPP